VWVSCGGGGLRLDLGVETEFMELTILLATRATLLAPDGHECWLLASILVRPGEGTVEEPAELEEEMSEDE